MTRQTLAIYQNYVTLSLNLKQMIWTRNGFLTAWLIQVSDSSKGFPVSSSRPTHIMSCAFGCFHQIPKDFWWVHRIQFRFLPLSRARRVYYYHTSVHHEESSQILCRTIVSGYSPVYHRIWRSVWNQKMQSENTSAFLVCKVGFQGHNSMGVTFNCSTFSWRLSLSRTWCHFLMKNYLH